MRLVDRMAGELQLPRKFIIKTANSAPHLYKEYPIRKRDGGARIIHHPSKQLKALQRWLLRRIIDGLPVHPSAFSYKKGLNIADNARNHVGSKYLLRMDLQEFFPWLTETDIRMYISDHEQFFRGWNGEDRDLFCALVCRQGKLTIGAPTSPALSNALCSEMDERLAQLASSRGATYTRYADDLFFSTDVPGVLRDLENEVSRVVQALRFPTGLQINRRKTRHSSRRGRRRVTGIVLGSDGRISAGRPLKRKIRSLIHKLDSLDPAGRRYLAGMLAFCRSVEREFINRLTEKYGAPRLTAAMRPETDRAT